MSQYTNFDLTGKKALLTGGARGLGRGIAEGLIEAGATVVVIDINPDVKEIAKSYGALDGYVCDITDFPKLEGLFGDIVKQLGGLDILCNIAGVGSPQFAHMMDMDKWRKELAINIDACMFLCKLAGGIFLKQKSGKVLNMASMTSYFGMPMLASYCTSKGAVKQLTKTLAVEWARFGVNVNALAPGYMATDLTDGFKANPDVYKMLSARIPWGRWGTPDDVKGPAVFLCSDAANYVTGCILNVDGGFLSAD